MLPGLASILVRFSLTCRRLDPHLLWLAALSAFLRGTALVLGHLAATAIFAMLASIIAVVAVGL